jgi:hypothetical protein
MGYYENLKCGKCKFSFTGGYVRSNGFLRTYLGVPYIKCPKCQNVNKTGFKPYSTFHLIEKIYHWFSIIIRYSIFGFMMGLGIFGISTYLLKVNTNNLNLLFLFVIVTILSMNIYAIFSELKDIKEIEKKYEEMT